MFRGEGNEMVWCRSVVGAAATGQTKEAAAADAVLRGAVAAWDMTLDSTIHE